MIYSFSDKGDRDKNEDSFCANTSGDKSIYIVADGCGGHGCGEIASRFVTEKLSEILLNKEATEDSIRQAIEKCNSLLIDRQMEHKGMRTTIVGLYKSKKLVFAFNVGDSRLFQIREGKVIFETEDHSVPYLLFKAGIIKKEEIKSHEDRNKLLEASENKDKLKINVYKIDAQKKDVFLLASDGFWEFLSEADLLECSISNADNWLNERIDYIKNSNCEDKDNYTALLLGDLI